MDRKIKILLIEDDQMVNKALSESMRLKGYEVASAFNAKEGLLLASSGRPDLILLDLGLPDAIGEEVLIELKQNNILDKSPVIILTNKSDGASLKKCLDLGASDYIIKVNFSFHELEASIEKILK